MLDTVTSFIPTSSVYLGTPHAAPLWYFKCRQHQALTSQASFPPAMSPAHITVVVSPGYLDSHTPWGMMETCSCWRVSGLDRGTAWTDRVRRRKWYWTKECMKWEISDHSVNILHKPVSYNVWPLCFFSCPFSKTNEVPLPTRTYHLSGRSPSRWSSTQMKDQSCRCW